jgi:hypothetical protein
MRFSAAPRTSKESSNTMFFLGGVNEVENADVLQAKFHLHLNDRSSETFLLHEPAVVRSLQARAIDVDTEKRFAFD